MLLLLLTLKRKKSRYFSLCMQKSLCAPGVYNLNQKFHGLFYLDICKNKVSKTNRSVIIPYTCLHVRLHLFMLYTKTLKADLTKIFKYFNPSACFGSACLPGPWRELKKYSFLTNNCENSCYDCQTNSLCSVGQCWIALSFTV